MTDELADRLSDDEMRQLIRLLARYCNHDRDQFDDWRLALPWGEVYVSISNALPPDHQREAYAEIWPFPPRLINSTPTADTNRDGRR